MRIILILMMSLGAGLLAGVLAASAFLAITFGIDLQSMDMFLFLDYLPSADRWGKSPYQEAYWIVAGVTALALIIAGFAVTRAKLAVYDDAHFQTKGEMRRNQMLEEMGAGLLFGRYIKPPNQPKNKPIIIEQEHHSWKRHLPKRIMSRIKERAARNPGAFISASFDKFPNALVIAPSGAGKTAGYVIPTTITSPGSMVILDVKGEIFEKTARLRRSYGDDVLRFAPFDFSKPSHQYNPLFRISNFKDLERQFTELQKISALFLQVDGNGAQDFVGGGAELFTAAGMLAIQRGNPTFGEIYRIIYGEGEEVGDEGIEDATERLVKAAKEAHYPSARQIFTEYAGMETKIRDSYLSVLKSAGLRQWTNPRVERLTRRNEIDFTTIRKKRQTIYLCVNSDDIPALNSLIRLFFSELIQFLRHNEPGEDEPIPVQIMLDEFFQLGYMAIIVGALLQLRSHGARVSIILQTVTGLGKYYSTEEIDIIMLGAVKLYITANDGKTADEIEMSLGTRTGLAVSRSQDVNAVGLNAGSVTLHSEDRPLLSAQQVRRLDNTKVIIFPERQYPILAERISYYSDPDLAPWYESQTGDLPYPDLAMSRLNDLDDEERLREARKKREAAAVVNEDKDTPKTAPVQEAAVAAPVQETAEDNDGALKKGTKKRGKKAKIKKKSTEKTAGKKDAQTATKESSVTAHQQAADTQVHELPDEAKALVSEAMDIGELL